MKPEDILSLVRAGFSKEDILTLYTLEPAKTEATKTEPAKTEATKTEPAKTEVTKTEPAKTESVNQNEPYTLTDEQFTKLLQTISVNSTSTNIDIPKTAESILQDRAKSLFTNIKEGDK